jgi:hypothetical protein
METFRSKVDVWFMVVVGVVIGSGVAGALAAAAAGTSLVPAVIILPIVGLVLWMWRSTRYIVTDASLLVQCAFTKASVPLADITAVRRSSTALAAPALSLDRIEVQHTAGLVVISPAKRDRFIEAITARNPRVDVTGVRPSTPEFEAQLRRHQGRLGLTVAAAVVVVGGLIALLNLRQLPPPRITFTDSGIAVASGPATFVVSPDEITGLALEDTLPVLHKRTGWGTYTSLRGRFRTDRAAGWVHVARHRPPYIVLQTADSFLILNDSDPQKTRAIYDSMSERWRSARR